ncbi:hypothetical protein C8F01DRAFT_1365657 [Mycena amicta]|nr:hypothetical protein C8F01DRAFT_1365657 [Mycena amicta]
MVRIGCCVRSADGRGVSGKEDDVARRVSGRLCEGYVALLHLLGVVVRFCGDVDRHCPSLPGSFPSSALSLVFGGRTLRIGVCFPQDDDESSSGVRFAIRGAYGLWNAVVRAPGPIHVCKDVDVLGHYSLSRFPSLFLSILLPLTGIRGRTPRVGVCFLQDHGVAIGCLLDYAVSLELWNVIDPAGGPIYVSTRNVDVLHHSISHLPSRSFPFARFLPFLVTFTHTNVSPSRGDPYSSSEINPTSTPYAQHDRGYSGGGGTQSNSVGGRVETVM